MPKIKRRGAIFLSSALLAGSLLPAAAEAKRPKPRTETGEYSTPSTAVTPVHPGGVAVCNQGGVVEGNRGCVDFPVMMHERFLTLEIVDLSGLPVPGFVAQSADISEWIPICGSTDKPLKIIPGAPMTVWTYAYRSPNLPLCAGSATTGTITATFSATR